VSVIANPQNPTWNLFAHAIDVAAASLSVQLEKVLVRDAGEIERAMNAFARQPDTGLIVLPDILFLAQREQIIALAAKHRVPVVYPYRFYVTAGGLMSYGVDNLVQWRQAATYVDQILKGAKPAELPIQQPTKFDFVINLITAKALGLTVPPNLLATADEVIE
jgi:putative tryptophan/tyrosine transport system substrate-binding protein